MIQHAGSTLLLYPEWIIWLAVGLSVANLLLAVASIIQLTGLSRRTVRDLADAADELARLRASHADLHVRLAARRERLSELMAEHEALRRKYDAVTRPMLPEDCA